MPKYAGPATTELKTNEQEVQNFLDYWFGDVIAGTVQIAWNDPNSGGIIPCKNFDIADLDLIPEFVSDINSKPGQSCFFVASVLKEDMPTGQRAKDDDTIYSPGVWADLDDQGVAENAPKIYSITKPTNATITGEHPYKRAQLFWKCREFIGDKDTLRTLNIAIAEKLEGDSSVTNPARLMRLPGTIAWPYKDGRVIERTRSGRMSAKAVPYDLSALQRAFPPQQAAPEATADPLNLDLGILNPDALRDDAARPGQWHNSVLRLVALYVNRGTSDTDIHRLCGDLTQAGYTQADTFKEVQGMIAAARRKWEIPDPATTQPEQKKPQSALEPIWMEDIHASLDSVDFVKGYLGEGQMSVVYGDSNTGKTFFVLDMALHVALGQTWRGKQVRQGGVIYCALEGSHGIRNRLVAFKKYYEGEMNGVNSAPLGVIASSIDLLDPDAHTDPLIEAIQAAKEKIGGDIKLVVIDTLARALAGGNENGPEDMGALVLNADRVRQETGAHVMFIHHSGKDTAKGSRGHSSLRAATDTEIEVVRQEGSEIGSVEVRKQREMEYGGNLGFRLESVEIGIDRFWGEPITSCVVMDADAKVAFDGPKLTDKERKAFEILRQLIATDGVQRVPAVDFPTVTLVNHSLWRNELMSRGVTVTENSAGERVYWQRIHQGLVTKGKIMIKGEFVWIP